MVRRTYRKGSIYIMAGCAMAGVSAGIGAAPALTQDRPGSLLERMQDEVAGVARQSRAAIVTIEDSRAVTLNYSSSALRQADLKDQIAHVQIDVEAINKEVARRQGLFDAGTLTLSELEQPRREQARREARLAYLRARLANVGVENAQTEQKEELRERVTELQSDYAFLSRQLKSEQSKVNEGTTTASDLNEVQRQLAHTRQDLATAQIQVALQDSVQVGQQQRDALRLSTTAQNSVVVGAAAPHSGSGFSIGDGLIVTTADVVQGMNTPVVSTDDGRQARANVVAVDSRLNIALLRLNANLNLPALRLGDSANVAPGHFAITMGNQTGQANSVALSTISALRTQGMTSAAHYYPQLLQIDGTVSAGTSGAPVLNARGEVIGMLAATPTAMTVADASGFTPGVSYQYQVLPSQNLQWKAQFDAFASSLARPATPNTKTGTTTLKEPLTAPPSVQSTTPAPPARFTLGAPQSMPALPQTTPGAQTVTPTMPTKPIGKATQQKPGERRTQTLDKTGQTVRVHYDSVPNQMLTYNIYRTPDAPFNAPTAISLSASSSSGFAIPVNAMKSVLDELKTGHNVVHAWLGMSLEDADNARYDNGIVSVDRHVKIAGIYDRSPASKAGLKQTGDIMTGLNDITVHTSNDVRAAVLLRFKPGQSVTAHLLRAGKPLDIPMMLEAVPTDVPPLLAAPLKP